MVLAQEGEQRWKGALLEDEISALWRITSNVSQRPNSLLTDVEDGRGEELDKERDGARVDDDLGVVRGSRGDVGEGPGGLELDHRVARREELNEPRDNASGDDGFDGWILLLREELSELRRGVKLSVNIVREDARDHGRQVGELASVENMGCLDRMSLCLSTESSRKRELTPASPAPPGPSSSESAEEVVKLRRLATESSRYLSWKRDRRTVS